MPQRRAPVIAMGLLLGAFGSHQALGQPPPAPAHHGTLPAVSPDGRQVAFISDRDGQVDLYVTGAEGGEARRLTSTATQEGRPTWSGDGREIFVSRSAEGSSTLVAIAYPAGTERIVARVDGRLPIALGSGRVLYATGDWGSMQLASAALDGSDVRRVSDGVGAIWGASVAPDAGRIAFGRSDAGTLQVSTMRADGRDVRPIGPLDGRAQMPAWSADGARLAIQVDTKPGGTAQARIWVVDVGTGARQELAAGTPGHHDEVPAWFPDGRRVAFQSDRSGRFEIWTIDVASGALHQLTR
ncbi:MAG: LpqB family beta-propeller domain-containing protein [Vicinamibacteraceae bacterium]